MKVLIPIAIIVLTLSAMELTWYLVLGTGSIKEWFNMIYWTTAGILFMYWWRWAND